MDSSLYEVVMSTDSLDATFLAAFAGVYLTVVIISLVVSLFMLICMWKINTKAGKPGIAAIIPIWNVVVLFQIAKLPLWYILLLFIPFANIYVIFKLYIELAKNFGKSVGFGIGMIFIPIIFIPVLAFGKAEYITDVAAPMPNMNPVNPVASIPVTPEVPGNNNPTM